MNVKTGLTGLLLVSAALSVGWLAVLWALRINYVVRYEFHPARDGTVLWRCDRHSGAAATCDLQNRYWTPIYETKLDQLTSGNTPP